MGGGSVAAPDDHAAKSQSNAEPSSVLYERGAISRIPEEHAARRSCLIS